MCAQIIENSDKIKPISVIWSPKRHKCLAIPVDLDSRELLERDLHPVKPPILFSCARDSAHCIRYCPHVSAERWDFTVSGALPRAHDARPPEEPGI